MKNVYKYIGLGVGIAVLLIVALCLTRREELVIANVAKHYSLLYESNLELETVVYSTHKKSKYFDLDNIENCKIISTDETQIVQLKEIKMEEQTVSMNEHDFYPVILRLQFSYIPENKCVLDDAKLEIVYKTNEKLNVKLGNICFLKVSKNKDFLINSVSSIVNDFGKMESLAALVIDLENISDKEYEIITIEPISNTIKTNYDYVKIFDDDAEFNNDVLINDVVGETFDSYKQSKNKELHLKINKNFRKVIVLPLTYEKKELVDSLGFVITYKEEEEIKQQIINPYRLFNTTNNEFVYYEYEITGN